ncbi:uridine kinase [soil metagenome]
MAGTAILIAGASGSGKTTLAERIADALDAVLLRTDDYYRPLNHLSYDERFAVNFDAPESVDGGLLCRHTRALLNDQEVEKPEYDFLRHTRGSYVRVSPRKAVVVEGLFALSYPTLNRQRTLSVFVETDAEVCLQRRIRRDVSERGRTPEEVVWRFRQHVRPMYLRYVAPCQADADLTVSGENDSGFASVMGRLGVTSPV